MNRLRRILATPLTAAAYGLLWLARRANGKRSRLMLDQASGTLYVALTDPYRKHHHARKGAAK